MKYENCPCKYRTELLRYTQSAKVISRLNQIREQGAGEVPWQRLGPTSGPQDHPGFGDSQ